MSIYSIITGVLILIVVGAGGYVFFTDTDLLTSSEMMAKEGNDEKTAEELSQDKPPLPRYGVAPELTGIVDWINSEPLTLEELRGKVVLIDFWTYSCINCIRTFPFVREWYNKYEDDGFVLIGVHTPEFSFEKERDNIVQAANENGLRYPIAMDNDYGTWEAFRNQFWPAHYLIDVNGQIRYRHFGEGKYKEAEEAIVQLLEEGGLLNDTESVSIDVEEVDFSGRQGNSPETYLGYRRISGLANATEETRTDAPFVFERPAEDSVQLHAWYFGGEWTIGEESAEATGAEGGSILYSYRGKEANLVMDTTTGEEMLVEVLLDGAPVPVEMRGQDVVVQEEKTFVQVKDSDLYNLVRGDAAGEHLLELKVEGPGLRGFAFTFG